MFGYPLVLMNRIRARMTAVAEPDPAADVRTTRTASCTHARSPEATAGRPAGPRTGTLRSSAWLDLGDARVVLTVPETHGRFYALSLVDLWTQRVRLGRRAHHRHGPRRLRHRGPGCERRGRSRRARC